MEDPIAREGTLARCNQDRDATAADPECINARRAASTAAARIEAERAERFEAESDQKREALRERIAAQQEAERRAALAAQAAEEAAYDAQWNDVSQPQPQSSYPADASPTWEQPVTAPSQLSAIELPQIESAMDKVLPEIVIPPSTSPAQTQPQLEELTIPRPFREPDGQ